MGNEIDVKSKELFKQVGEENVIAFANGYQCIAVAYDLLLQEEELIRQLNEYEKSNVVLKPSASDIDNIIQQIIKDKDNYSVLFQSALYSLTSIDSMDAALRLLKRFIKNGRIDFDALEKSISDITPEEQNALLYLLYCGDDEYENISMPSQTFQTTMSPETKKLVNKTTRKLLKTIVAKTRYAEASDICSLIMYSAEGNADEAAKTIINSKFLSKYMERYLSDSIDEDAAAIGLSKQMVNKIPQITAALAVANTAIDTSRILIDASDEKGYISDADWGYASFNAVGGVAVGLSSLVAGPVGGLLVGMGGSMAINAMEDQVKGNVPIGNTGYYRNGKIEEVYDIDKTVNNNLKKEYKLRDNVGMDRDVGPGILIKEYANGGWKQQMNNIAHGDLVSSTMSPKQQKYTTDFFNSVVPPQNGPDRRNNLKAYNEYKEKMGPTYQSNPAGFENINHLLQRSGYLDIVGADKNGLTLPKKEYWEYDH